MRKSPSRTPRHGKHQMNRNPQYLSAMNMGKTRRVRDDRICDKRFLREWIILDTRFPASIQHFSYHDLLFLNLAITQCFHLWDQSWILDHVCHELCWISANREELQERVAHEIGKDIVRRDAYPMAVALQCIPQCNEGLDVSTTAHNLNYDVEFYIAGDKWWWLNVDIIRWRLAKVLFLLVGDLRQ